MTSEMSEFEQRVVKLLESIDARLKSIEETVKWARKRIKQLNL